MRILIACDKFKGSLDAAGACSAIAAGLHDADPTIEIDKCPLADGGDGTGDILASHHGAKPQTQTVRGPLQRQHTAMWWWEKDAKRAIIEMAQASGLALLDRNEYAPLETTTYGTGELIAAALARDATEILVAVGGSATIDGGIGALQALGWEFYDRDNKKLPIGGGQLLSQVARVVPPSDKPAAHLTILADVKNPLCGPNGATSV
ncbi:MAG: glycerate kinase, partial [Phycisphaerae bacterium]